MTLSPGLDEPCNIAVDSATIFWADQGVDEILYAMPLAGGGPRSLASPGFIRSIAIDDGSVYFTTLDSVFAVPKAGGQSRNIASGENNPYAIAADSSGVYWVTRNDGTVRMAK